MPRTVFAAGRLAIFVEEIHKSQFSTCWWVLRMLRIKDNQKIKFTKNCISLELYVYFTLVKAERGSQSQKMRGSYIFLKDQESQNW